jgi:hypothetical protein
MYEEEAGRKEGRKEGRRRMEERERERERERKPVRRARCNNGERKKKTPRQEKGLSHAAAASRLKKNLFSKDVMMLKE